MNLLVTLAKLPAQALSRGPVRSICPHGRVALGKRISSGARLSHDRARTRKQARHKTPIARPGPGLRRLTESAAAGARARRAGFSLVEMAIVMMIITIAFGSISGIGLRLSEQQRLHQRIGNLEAAREALLAYALERGHLPCPAPDSPSGALIEARGGAGCQTHSGLLPSASLGLRLSGAPRLRYAASPEFADDRPRTASSWPCGQDMHFASFSLCDRGHQRIYSAQPLNTGNLLADDIAAVILDSGSPQGPRNADEAENLDGNRSFVRGQRGDSFDDEITWISANTLKYQLARVGLMY